MAFATMNSADIYETSWPRDNTFCQVGNKKIEFSIRGHSKYTEPKDRGYGELLFFDMNDKHINIPDFGGRSGYVRFFKAENGLCSKSAAYDLDGSTFALLLLKSNRPYKDKLVIQLFDSKNLKVLETFSTEYMADKTMLAPGGFTFRTNPERMEVEMGVVTIEGKKFNYQDRDFQEWMNFEKRKFSMNEKLTYQESPYKSFFKNEADFLKTTGWSAEDKKFSNRTLYLAVNHQTQRKCLLVLPAPTKLTGTEEWRCQDK
jgi:hypothetical protein